MTLTASELSLCVRLIGRGWTLQQSLDRVRAERQQLSFHQLLVHPGTGAKLDAMLDDNARIDAAIDAAEKGRVA